MVGIPPSPLVWRYVLKAGHAAIIIRFKDGTVIYLDDGNVGGTDHVFLGGDVPWRCLPQDGWPKDPRFTK
jgi:hypothetical protein